MSESVILHGVPIYVRHDRPAVEALGISDGVVVAAGSRQQVRASLPDGAVEQELPHGAVMPAFVDAHQHAFLIAMDPQTDALYRKAQDIPGLLRVVAELVRRAPDEGPDQWLRFHGYEPLGLSERRSPTAAELDSVCPDRPLHVLTRTYHESAVNTQGLRQLGLGRGAVDPPGGRVVKGRRGQPTGVLLESASFIAESQSRPVEATDQWRLRLRAYGQTLAALGIGRIGDAAVPHALASDVVDVLAEVGIGAHPLLIGSRIDEPSFMTGGTAKVLADGGEYCHLCMSPAQMLRVMRSSTRASLGSDGALARAVGRRAGFPHRESDGQWHSGIRYPQEADLPGLFRAAADAGSALAVHAVGNGSVEAVLRAAATDPGVTRDVPLRVEHAIAPDPDLLHRIGEAGIPVVVQPAFLSAFGHELNLVPVPLPMQLMPFRTMLDSGVAMAFSSDHPAADLSPWSGIAAAVLREDSQGKVIHPDERITRAQALTAYTQTSAQVLDLADAGTLEPGMRADLIWCDHDPHRCQDDQLGTIATLATWTDGRCVYQGSLAHAVLS